MATWDPPIDADLAVGKPGRPSHARAIRDLPSALAERAAGAPWINRIGDMMRFHADFKILSDPPEWAGEYDLVGTWEVPASVYRIAVTLVGGGGAGGNGYGNSLIGLHVGGGGGGAGAVNRAVIEVEPFQVYSIKIGAGGRLSAIHPSVDTSLDDFVIGDGARTVFGTLLAAGGKQGDSGILGGEGGAGGRTIEGYNPPITGADGGSSLQVDVYDPPQIRSGSGAPSTFGGGAPGRNDTGEGHTNFGVSCSIPGSGGGGGHPIDGPLNTKAGGRGSNGIVVVRY